VNKQLANIKNNLII